MQVLFTGVYKKFNDDITGLKTSVTGLYLDRALQGTAYPYIVYHKISGRPDWTFTEDMENILLQFNIFDDHSSSTTVNDIFKKFKAVYDWCSLDIVGWNSIYMKRELDNLTRDNDIWNYFLQFRLEIQK